MLKLDKLTNGLTLITIAMPQMDSVTTLLAVAAGSRYESKRINGLSHFLEHMFFKGSKKFPTAQMIASLVDGIGAINNAGTEKEWTDYWIKSSSKNIELAADILSSMLKEPLVKEEEIDREKGVIAEELRMYRDTPQRFVFDLYERLQFGDQPLGWDIGGDEETVNSLRREDFLNYMESLYSPENMALVFAGNLPRDIKALAEKYFSDLPKNSHHSFQPFKKPPQAGPKIDVFYKRTDQANLILGVLGYDRYDSRRYAARVLAVILGEGMSSRLFIEVRERRGLAYHVSADHSPYKDAGTFLVYSGLKLEKVEEGLEVIKRELEKIVQVKVTEEELKKAKEMIRGRIALRSESTNFLAEHFGIEFVLDGELETFEEYLEKIDSVTAEDVQRVAKELFCPDRYNLQVIGPFKSGSSFKKILQS